MYDVSGIVTPPDGCWYFLVDAEGLPMQRQATFCRIISQAVPPGWHVNVFPESSTTVLGPSFLVKSIQNVDDLVELRPDQVENVRSLLYILCQRIETFEDSADGAQLERGSRPGSIGE